MTDVSKAGTYLLGDKPVTRIGYGAMQLAGWGRPPKDRLESLALLRDALAVGVNHIDTADFYGPRVVNELIREALYPYPDDLVIVTKVGAHFEADTWSPAQTPAELVRGVHDNLARLGVDKLDVVNLRIIQGRELMPVEGSIEERFTALAELQEQGLIRHLGLSNVTPAQVQEAQRIAPVVCVQNLYNLAHRDDDDLIDALAEQQIAYVPYFPLGGLNRLQSETLTAAASEHGVSSMQIALAWLLARSPNILLIPGTSSIAHLRENLAVAELSLPGSVLLTIGHLVQKESQANQ